MPKVDRCERIDSADQEDAVAQLNRLGSLGWQVFQLEATTDGYCVWLSREIPFFLQASQRAAASGHPVTDRQR